MTAKGNSHITSRIRGYQMCSVCSSSAVPFVTVISCRREKNTGIYSPATLSPYSTQNKPLLTLCLTNELQFTHRASSATKEVTPGSPSPRANPPLHPLLQSGETPWPPDRKVSQEFSPHSNGELLSCTSGITNSSACCFPSWGHWVSWDMGTAQTGSFGSCKSSGGRCSKALFENLELWGQLLCHPGLSVSFNKLGVNHILNVS